MALEIGEVLDLVDETPTVKIIRVVVPNKKFYDYKPGQFFNFYLAENPQSTNPNDYRLARPYSVVSSPTNKNFLEVAFRIAGNFTGRLAKLNPGDKVGVNGPFGAFIFNENTDKDVVMLAGGIGITPFVSTLRYATDKQLGNKFTLFYSNRFANEVTMHSELLKLQNENKNINCVFTITREITAGFEHGRIDKTFLKKYAGNLSEKVFYICGAHDFILAMAELLLKLGVDKSKIKKEDFGFVKKTN